MTLFFNTFIAESKMPAEPARLARLDWIVLSDENRIVRGFQFYIDPLASNWEMTEEGALVESGHSFNLLALIGHPIEKVLAKFIYDHDFCQRVVTPDCERCFSILIEEACRVRVSAKTRIKDRVCLGNYADEALDLKGGLQPLIDFFVKKDEKGFFEFVVPKTA